MTSSKSYLLNAMYEWILDNQCTPHVLVDAFFPGVEVPQQFVKDGQIVLNIAPQAVVGMAINKTDLRFTARFGGIPTNVVAPLPAILGIYTRENGQGMMFDPEPPPPKDTPPTGPTKGPTLVSSKRETSSGEKPSLRVVK